MQGMERKWERHYRETRTTVSIGLVLVGLACMVSLVFMWPQKYSSQVFNERLKFNLILDVSLQFRSIDYANHQIFTIYSG